MQGLEFLSAAPLFSVEDTIRALDLAASAGLRDIVEMHVPSLRARPVEIDFFVQDLESDELPGRRTLVYDGSSLTEPPVAPRRPGRGGGRIGPDAIGAVLPLATILRGSGIAADETVSRVRLRSAGGTTICMIELASRHHVAVDAVTGRPMGGR